MLGRTIKKLWFRITAADRTPEYCQNRWANIKSEKRDWLESYWRQNARREYLASEIVRLPDVSSVIEMGCNVGANLYAIHKIDPSIKLAGIDINEDALSFGREKFAQENIEVDMKKLSLHDLSSIPDNSYDVVFTSSVLMHIPDETSQGLLENLVRIARRFVVSLEVHAFSKVEYDYHKKLNRTRFRDRWCRDYFADYGKIVAQEKIRIHQIPPSMMKLDISHTDIKVDSNALVCISV